MNVNFGQNLASMALNNFMAMGNMMTQTANAMRSPGMQQFMNMGQNSFGVGGGFAFAAAGNFQTPGFLPQPMGGGANFAQMGQAMNGMAQPWNMMGNMLNGGMPGMMNMPNPQQIMGQMMGMMQNIANMMNQMAPQMQMMNQLNHAKQATAMGQMPGTVMPNQAPGTTKLPGTAPSFPGQAASDFISTLPNDKNGVAKALNVGGSKDVTRINQALGMLKTAKPKLSPANGEAPKAGLQLSAQDVQAIRAAKTPQEAKSIVMKAIGKKVGMNLENINMKDKKGIRNSKARDAVNKLLGTKVRNGTEKNSGSSLVLDSMAESIVKSVRGGDFGSTQVQSPGGLAWAAFGAGGAMGAQQQMGGMGMGMAQQPGMDYNWCGTSQHSMGMGAGMAMGGIGVWQVPGQVQTIPNPASALNIDLGGFVGAANKVGELASPLIFDLEGTGLEISNPSMIEADIDGDGKIEVITDLDSELGLLVFDSKGEEEYLTGADMFGDNTDLSAYGIQADSEDGNFKDGFQALRVLCEHFKLVDAGKQYLDAGDLSFLEENVGLRMRVGGIVSGDDRDFASVGVTQINLGNPEQTQHIDDAKEDRWGNKIMLQDGATFTVHGDVRPYADIWFKVQARYSENDSKEKMEAFSKADLLSKSSLR